MNDLITQLDSLPPWATRMFQEAFKEAKKTYLREKLAFHKYREDPVGFGRDVLGARYTKDIEKLMQSVVENPITVGRSANAIGKTHASSHLAIWWYSVYHDAQVYVTAAPPLSNLKNLLWGEILNAVRSHEGLFARDRQVDLMISRNPLSFITGVTIPMTGTSEERESKFSGKHAPHILFIVDEGDAVPDEVYTGIESCMSGGMARLLVLFNPRAKAGPVYDMEAENRARVIHLSSFDHPNVVTGKDVIPGAVTRETVVRRINEWTRTLVAGENPAPGEYFDVPPFLVGKVARALSGIPYPPLPEGRRVIMEAEFAYMVLGEYPSQGQNQLISVDWIEAARQRWDIWVQDHGEIPPTGASSRMGLDVSEFGHDFNVPILRYGSYVARIKEIWQGVDPIVTGDKALAFCEAYNPNIIVVDGTGVGSAVAPYMARQRRGLTVYSAKFAGKPSPMITTELGEFFQLRDQLWWACREWLRTDPNAMLPPEPMLVQELAVPTYEVRNGKIMVMKKEIMCEKLKRSPNFADALVLTFMPAERVKVIPLVG